MNSKYFIFAFFLILQGCATPGWQSVKLQDYLQPYIGQSADNIQQNLNLRSLGYQTLKQPQKTNQNLVFTVLRPMNIPIPMNMGISDGSRLSTSTTYSQSYDINFYCHIIFELDQQQIARSIRYEGKAC
ncbi:hypothetical protein [Acinetobacter tjernbergiae]|uniref:Lipoprotein n=1 Tax=Acinetobacter tjernbergiae DSM 14971 = CIP 107465 TaxID=1120928 RepID=V2UZT2_9GAMM|nr:hypothetical protein [Acinetobacter tjernbergiae]ESK55522.1 hypothetical protein F990_01814 [Acinetobacter tjernbergiae DSM 14971 = CIP 107465]